MVLSPSPQPAAVSASAASETVMPPRSVPLRLTLVDGVGAGDVYAETGGAGHEQRDDNDTYYSDFFCGVPGALFLGRQVLVFSFFFHFILGFVIIFFVPRA